MSAQAKFVIPLQSGPMLVPARTSLPVDSAEYDRLVESDKMLQHLIQHCTYLEDGANFVDVWSKQDDDRQHIGLREYLTIRLTGQSVPDVLRTAEDTELCGFCEGSGEGLTEGSTCRACNGSGADQWPTSEDVPDRLTDLDRCEP